MTAAANNQEAGRGVSGAQGACQRASHPPAGLAADWVSDCGTVRLFNRDCREVLGMLDCVAVITDPPYGVDFQDEEWDGEVPRIALALPYLFDRVALIMGTTAAWKFPTPKWVACWARPASNSRSKVGGFSHWSPILLYGDIKMPVDFKSWHAIANAYPQGFGHPSPKPECVMEWLVGACAEEHETVLDPFMGSGTTGVACVRLGRRFIGIERERKYFDLAVSRITAELNRCPLFKDEQRTQRSMWGEDR